MSNIIPTKRLKFTFWLFALTAFLTLLSPWTPLTLRAAGAIALGLFGLIMGNLIMAIRLYRHILKIGTRFSFVP
jgi:hypothetical protein